MSIDSRNAGGVFPTAPQSDTRWRIPQSAIEASYAEMAGDGRRDREGIALWAGHRDVASPELAIVSYVVLLRGTGIVRARAFIRITPELLNEVTDVLAELGEGVYLVGQIHGHPPRSSTDLSWSDIAYGIRTPHYMSAVAPSYGMTRSPALSECGIHVFERDNGWRRLSAIEANDHIEVDHHTSVQVIAVGDVDPVDTADEPNALWAQERSRMERA